MIQIFNPEWETDKISNVIIDLQGGFSYAKNKLVTIGIPQLRPYNINNNSLHLDDLVYVPNEHEGAEKFFLKKDDILFNNTNSVELVGKSAIVKEDMDVTFSNHIYRIKTDTSIVEPKWLNYCIYRYWLVGRFQNICKKWIGQAGVNSGKLENLEIPTPKLSIQKEIIKKIEKYVLMIEQLKMNRQHTIEKSAVMDQSKINEQFSKDNLRSWPVKTLEKYLYEIETCNPKKQPTKKFKYIEIGSVDSISKKITSFKNILGKDAPSRARNVIHTDDVIYGTTRPYYRKSVIVDSSFDDEVCSTGLCVLRIKDHEKLTPKFLNYFLQSDYATDQIIDSMKGAHYPAVSNKAVFGLDIKVPDIEIQEQIVEKIEKIRKIIHELRSVQKNHLELIDALIPSIINSSMLNEKI